MGAWRCWTTAVGRLLPRAKRVLAVDQHSGQADKKRWCKPCALIGAGSQRIFAARCAGMGHSDHDHFRAVIDDHAHLVMAASGAWAQAPS